MRPGAARLGSPPAVLEQPQREAAGGMLPEKPDVRARLDGGFVRRREPNSILRRQEYGRGHGGEGDVGRGEAIATKKSAAIADPGRDLIKGCEDDLPPLVN